VVLSGLQAGSSDSLASESAPGTPRLRLCIAARGHGQLLQIIFAVLTVVCCLTWKCAAYHALTVLQDYRNTPWPLV
jgi:hypothetical protein